VFGHRHYWIRGRLSDATPELQRRLRRVSVNTTWASHASTTTNEIVGSSNGNANQTFTLSQTPVLLGQRIEVKEGEVPAAAELTALLALEGADALTVIPAKADRPQEVWVRWHEVADFYSSGPLDRHYLLDHTKGTVTFGNGTSGRIPPIGSQNLRAAHYRWGGGTTGNRAAGSITQILTTIPFVQAVEQHEDAGGGADAETLDRVKSRTSRILRHHGRAVTAQDFEDLAFEASPTVARVAAVTPTFIPSDQDDAPNPGGVLRRGKVLVIIVPKSAAPRPAPSPELLGQVRDYLLARCTAAVELQVTGAKFAEVKVTAAIVPSSLEATEIVLASARDSVHRFLHPLTGGADGKGWAFGQQPHVSDIYAQLAKIPGIDHIASLTLTCNPVLELDASDPNATDPETQRAKLTYLIHSGNDHQITLAAPSSSTIRRKGAPR
jgi:predicted phage baseplate assembly protein